MLLIDLFMVIIHVNVFRKSYCVVNAEYHISFDNFTIFKIVKQLKMFRGVVFFIAIKA